MPPWAPVRPCQVDWPSRSAHWWPRASSPPASRSPTHSPRGTTTPRVRRPAPAITTRTRGRPRILRRPRRHTPRPAPPRRSSTRCDCASTARQEPARTVVSGGGRRASPGPGPAVGGVLDPAADAPTAGAKAHRQAVAVTARGALRAARRREGPPGMIRARGPAAARFRDQARDRAPAVTAADREAGAVHPARPGETGATPDHRRGRPPVPVAARAARPTP